MRIVSLAPSITEILFALGVGDRVIGATQYCDYPPAALDIPRIGGYYDPNYERIYGMTPDLVIMLREHTEAAEACRKLGLNTLLVPNATIDEILESMLIIGRRCAVRERARKLTADLRQRLDALRADDTADTAKPKMLVSIGRTMGSGSIRDVSIAGRSTMYDELVRWVGGRNAYQGPMSYPSIGREGIIRMQPDIILDVVADLESKGLTESEVREQWAGVEGVPAVENGSVHIIPGDYAVIPGPRSVKLAEDFARALEQWRQE